MDTPDKKIQPTNPSLFPKFEDSPVFNYLSTLSPIKPFNLGHSGQSFQLLSFASPQSSLTSPLTNFSRESKITRAILLPDEPNDNCTQDGIDGRTAGKIISVRPTDLHNEDVRNFGSGGEANVSATDESSKLAIELPKSLNYHSGSPGNNVASSDAVKPESECDVAGTLKSSTDAVQNISKEAGSSCENEMGKQRIQLEKTKEVCDWENFIYEAPDILNCGTPTEEKYHEELDKKCVDSGMFSFVETVLLPPNDFIDDTMETDSDCPPLAFENHDNETPLTKPGVGKASEVSLISAVKSHTVLAEEVVHYSSAETVDKQQKMTRRRCLVYEMSGTHYRKLLDSSPISKPPASPSTSKEKCLIPSKPGGNKFSLLLPGIGLHLNALAATSRDKIIVKRQTLTCRRQLITSTCAIPSVDSANSDTKPLDTPSTLDPARSDSNEKKDELHATENIRRSSIFEEGMEFPPSSPKKRQKPENVGDADSCKRCNCKRSKCLKLYCECFAAGLYCVDSCNCQDCFNKPIHEETVLEMRMQIESRNPLAFAPKVIRCSSTPHIGNEQKKTPASARHKRGCNCKKSGCLKKYCECFQGGVGCSLSCRCEGCKNTYGQKEGTEGIGIFGEAPKLEKVATNLSSYYDASETDAEHQDEVQVEHPKQQDEANAEPLNQATSAAAFSFSWHNSSIPFTSQCTASSVP